MGKNIFFSAFLLFFMPLFSAFAQQSIWGGPQSLVSPQINDDNTVTFRLFAPDAYSVQVTGDCIPEKSFFSPDGDEYKARIAEMVDNEPGVWEYTLPEPLESELYSYNFIVDGVKITDPSNVYMIRDVASVFSVFIVGGGQGDLYRVNDVPHGTVSRMWYDSPALGMERRITVYTPAGYEDSSRKYPVLYLLHGMGGDEEAWISLGRTAQILDNLIAQGKAEPMIVVMPNGNAYQEAAPGESSEGMLPPVLDRPRSMEGSYETSFPDIVKFVDSHFRTVRKKSARAVAGLSMGGFHSLHISCHYPDMFDYVGLFSAAIYHREGLDTPVYDNVEGQIAEQFSKGVSLYYIAIGDEDFLYEDNAEYRAFLDNHGYPYEYHESSEGHIWKNWRIYLSDFVPLLFK